MASLADQYQKPIAEVRPITASIPDTKRERKMNELADVLKDWADNERDAEMAQLAIDGQWNTVNYPRGILHDCELMRPLIKKKILALGGSVPVSEVDALAARVAELEAEKAEFESSLEIYENALNRISQWAQAYPLEVFPEPDFDKARELLKAGGMTLDAISASNMRYVINGVGDIANKALTLS
jgi:hypothetical protein